MKLMQTPSLITGAILGASLITLSAASNDSALGGLNVFVPGTTVSSTEVNDNFTMVVDEVSALEGRLDNLESSSVSEEYISGHSAPGLSGYHAMQLLDSMEFTVPAGKQIRLTSVNGSHYTEVWVVRADGGRYRIAEGRYDMNPHIDFNTGFILHEGDGFELKFQYDSTDMSWCGVLIDAQ